GVGFSFGLQDAHLRLGFRMLHVARLLRFGFQLGDFDLFLFDFRFGAEALVFLLLLEQAFQALCVFIGELQVAEQNFADEDAVGGEALGDGRGGGGAQLFALGGENFASNVI